MTEQPLSTQEGTQQEWVGQYSFNNQNQNEKQNNFENQNQIVDQQQQLQQSPNSPLMPLSPNDNSDSASSSSSSSEANHFSATKPKHRRDINIDAIRDCFDLPEDQAAKKLKVSKTHLKRICREFNIRRWPYRRLKSYQSRISKAEKTISDAAATDQEKQTAQQEVFELEKRRTFLKQNPSLISESSPHDDSGMKIDIQIGSQTLSMKELQQNMNPQPFPTIGNQNIFLQPENNPPTPPTMSVLPFGVPEIYIPQNFNNIPQSFNNIPQNYNSIPAVFRFENQQMGPAVVEVKKEPMRNQFDNMNNYVIP